MLPPYGKILLAYQNESITLKNSIYIFVGKNSFKECKIQKEFGVLSTCIPEDKSYSQYEWPIKNQAIVLCDCGGMDLVELKKITFNFLHQGARSVCLFTELAPLEVFTPESNNGL